MFIKKKSAKCFHGSKIKIRKKKTRKKTQIESNVGWLVTQHIIKLFFNRICWNISINNTSDHSNNKFRISYITKGRMNDANKLK